MRLRGMVVGSAAIVLMASVGGCGDGESAGGGASNDGYGQSAGSGGRLMDAEPPGPPSAPTMADIETFVSQRTTCTDLEISTEPDEDIPEETGATWGIKERAICFNVKGNYVRLMSIDDMRNFQTQAKRVGGGYLVGKDFAVDSATSLTRDDFKESGLLQLVCDPEEQIPSGYKKQKALVEGCVLTDFIS
ncbi:hypothetical protein AB0M42_11160 [Streptomyces sp. NPDC051784]|uniref:hypothetical protein n=1 Tax=Streptomyces sp. NPDC051784 TaxID=3155805 RepID=UPI003445A726